VLPSVDASRTARKVACTVDRHVPFKTIIQIRVPSAQGRHRAPPSGLVCILLLRVIFSAPLHAKSVRAKRAASSSFSIVCSTNLSSCSLRGPSSAAVQPSPPPIRARIAAVVRLPTRRISNPPPSLPDDVSCSLDLSPPVLGARLPGLPSARWTSIAEQKTIINPHSSIVISVAVVAVVPSSHPRISHFIAVFVYSQSRALAAVPGQFAAGRGCSYNLELDPV
jgi:hypothetical protein